MLYKNYCTLMTCGLTKEQFDNEIEEINSGNVLVTFEEKYLIGKIIIMNDNASEEEFYSIFKKIVEKYSENIYADIDIKLEEVLIRTMSDSGYKLGVAESITGGLICSKLASIPGCSRVLYEGLVVYDSNAKVRRLHVSSSTIEENGPISRETLSELLKGILSNKEIDFAIATTGCAGPQSYSKDIPQGMAFVGVASRKEERVSKNIYKGDRNEVRESVANYAMFMLIKMIKKEINLG